MTLAVVTDSSACLPRALADSRGIEVVALHLDKETGTTSRPSVTELARAYRRAAGRADEVLAVHQPVSEKRISDFTLLPWGIPLPKSMVRGCGVV